MKRTSDAAEKDEDKNLPTRLFAANPTLLIGAAFELGMLLGRRSSRTPMGRKVRDVVADVADRVMDMAPDAVSNLVPDLAPAKAHPRKRTAKK
jgi:hypothetical protein